MGSNSLISFYLQIFDQHNPTNVEELNEFIKLHKLPGSLRLPKNSQYIEYRRAAPPKPNSDKEKWHQQPFATHQKENRFGLRKAFLFILQIEQELLDGTFDWKNYSQRLKESDLVSNCIQRYREYYLTIKKFKNQPRNKEISWKEGPEPYLKKLLSVNSEKDKQKVKEGVESNTNQLEVKTKLFLTKHLVITAIESAPKDSNARKRMCGYLKDFIAFIKPNFSIELERYEGNYSRSKVKKRNLPDDAFLVQIFPKLPNGWNFVFALMLVFGLRNHEIWYLDLSPLRNGKNYIEVLNNTKTGARRAFAFYEKWVDALGLRDLRLPSKIEQFTEEFVKNPEKVPDSVNRRRGEEITKGLRLGQFQEGLTPYDLRHCWSVRVAGWLTDSMAAKSQGHRVSEHVNTYRKHISDEELERRIKLSQSHSFLPELPLP